jgi:hypothetical protein
MILLRPSTCHFGRCCELGVASDVQVVRQRLGE